MNLFAGNLLLDFIDSVMIGSMSEMLKSFMKALPNGVR
jgi:hypothetical protein